MFPVICGIYKITSPTGKIYIGQSKNCYGRFRQYKQKCFSKEQRMLFNSFKKHGTLSHEFKIIFECEERFLDHFEEHYIKEFNSFQSDHGMNLTSGGKQNKKISPETGKLISEIFKQKGGVWNKGKKGLYKHTEEIKNFISKVNTGKNHPMYGKHHTEEAKKAIKEKTSGVNSPRFGKHHTEEVKNKIRELKIGFKHSEESKAKIRLASLGRKWKEESKALLSAKLKTYKKSPEHIEKIHKKTRKPILQYSLSGEFIKEWASIKVAAVFFNGSSTNIIANLKKRKRHAYGFIWEYKFQQKEEYKFSDRVLAYNPRIISKRYKNSKTI